MVDDVYRAIESVHMSGALHAAIVQDLPRYITPAPCLPTLLSRLTDAGKRFFLCTNSGFDYSNRTLSHLLDIPCSSSGHEWRDLFDLVICSANKPSFYTTDCKEKLPFREWDVTTNSASTRPVTHPSRGHIYVNGSAQALSDCTGWQGKDILYLGDNLQSDLQEARRWHGWHTGTEPSRISVLSVVNMDNVRSV